MHGQLETDEANDRRFFVEAVNKSVHGAMLNHNIAFLNTFHNTMKKVFHGYPFEQVGPTYFNISHLSTQGINHASTSLQGAAQARDDDAQIVQDSSEQIQGATVIQMRYNPRSSA
jgi:hypothetical protein